MKVAELQQKLRQAEFNANIRELQGYITNAPEYNQQKIEDIIELYKSRKYLIIKQH